MKKVAFLIIAVILTTVVVSCKNESQSTQNQQEETAQNGDLAVAITALENSASESQYLYVTAPSGLSLREYGNLNSEKLARMPYGTKVKVIKAEDKATMTVSGIKGNMHEVEFNHKKGFAFNGYLSKFFPPEKDILPKGYASELKEVFPDVIFSETVSGSVSKPINTETLTLPTHQWHEAFFVAQRLFDFPKEFQFPNPKGKNTEVIKDKMPKKDIWISELHITRKDNALEKIEYVYSAKDFSSKVSIVKDAETMKISKVESIL